MRTNKLVSLVLALMMAMFAVSALAEEPAEPSPSTVDISFVLNAATVGSLFGAEDAESAKMVDTIAEVINNLGIHVVSDGVDAELDITSKNEPVISAAFLRDTDCTKILSTLFPNTVLKLEQDAIPATPKVSIDPETLTVPFEKAMADIMSKVGDEEDAAETIFDTAFTKKRPINITTKEALLTIFGALRDILGSEQTKSLIESLKSSGVEVSISDIEEEIEKIKNSSDEDLPAMEAALFSNENKDEVLSIKLTKEEQTIDIKAGTVAEGLEIECTDGTQFVKLHAPKDEATELRMNLDMDGMPLGIAAKIYANEKPSRAAIDIAIANTQLLEINITAQDTGVLSGKFSVEGKNEISTKDLEAAESEAFEAFMAEIQTGAITSLSTLMQQFPNLATVMQNLQ